MPPQIGQDGFNGSSALTQGHVKTMTRSTDHIMEGIDILTHARACPLTGKTFPSNTHRPGERLSRCLYRDVLRRRRPAEPSTMYLGPR